MIVGDCRMFAIESGITNAVESLSQLALGYFVIHIDGRTFGVKQPDASILGCSFSEVERRLQQQGKHLLPLLNDTPAIEIAAAYIDAFYHEYEHADYFGLSRHEFIGALLRSGVTWAPDGDEAFDDGSHVLQFDVDGRVRLIGFMNKEPFEAGQSVREVWLNADLFYAIVSSWKTLFAVERTGRLNGAGATGASVRERP